MKSRLSLCLALFPLALWAADPPPIDESALFGATILREVSPQQAASGVNLTAGTAPTTTPTTPSFVPTVRWGGSADTSVSAGWNLYPWPDLPLWDKGSATVNGIVYLDARPTELSRFYLEGSVTHDLDKGTSTKVREMFLDTSWNRQVNFRAGKQRIAWGVGTWFSPADVLSLEAIDLTDTSKKREGPFAVKAAVPVGFHSLTLYTVLPQDPGVKGVAFAPRAEFLLGTLEIGLAGYWRPDASVRPRAMVLATGDLGPLNLSFEGVALWGSDRQWVRRVADGSLQTWTDNQNLYWQAAAGLGGMWTAPEQDVALSLQGQYFYNGNGYDDPAVLADASSAVKKLVDKGTLTAADLANPGKHYLAANLGVTKLFGDTVNLGASGWVNWGDLSFRATPSVTLKPFPLTTIRLQAAWDEGAKGRQYSPQGRMVTPSLKLTVFETVSAEVQAPWKASTGETGLKTVVSFTVPGF